jgi:hypothetical protein
MGEFPPPPLPPHMGEFSRLLMQQGEKSLEHRLKELDRLKDQQQQHQQQQQQQQGHVCSLCSQNFQDIVSLQVHIIKSHGALPPGTAGLDSLFHQQQQQQHSRKQQQQQHGEEPDEDRSNRNNNNNNNSISATEDATMAEESDDIAEPEVGAATDGDQQLPPQQPGFLFPLEKSGLELLQRQLTSGGQFPVGGMLGMPAVLLAGGLPGFGQAAGQQQQQQFQGLFNMFLSEMLKKVQKDTPPQTPPVSPAATPPNGSNSPPPANETAAGRLGEAATTS